jgi:hypothetical protein
LTPHQSPKSSNSISIPSSDDPTIKPDPTPQHKDQSSIQQYGCGQRARHQQGHYKAMNKGLVMAIAPSVNEIIDDKAFEEDADETNNPYKLPPDIALAGHYALDPSMLDKALYGPNVKEWQEALDYEIG